MKTFWTWILLSMCMQTYAQLTTGFNYQAVARDANGDPRAGVVTLQFIIHQGNTTGATVLEETHNNVQLNAFGLFSRVIGSVNRQEFENINWENGPYFLEVRIDGQALGPTTQFQAVPYSKIATQMDLEDLQNVSTDIAPQDGQVLQWNNGFWAPANGGGEYQPIFRQIHFSEDREVLQGERKPMGNLEITIPAEGCVEAIMSGDARPVGEGNGAAIFYGIVKTENYPRVQAGQIPNFLDISTAMIYNYPISAQTSRFSSFGLTRLLSVDEGLNSFTVFIHNSPGNGDMDIVVGQINLILKYFPNADCRGAHRY